MSKKKPVEVIFAPGCFDTFEGTQEELDALQEEILAMFKNGVPTDREIVMLDEESLTAEEWAILDAAEADMAQQGRGKYLQ